MDKNQNIFLHCRYQDIPIFLGLVQLLLLSGIFPGSAVAAPPSIDTLRREIVILDHARSNVVSELEKGTISKHSRRDYSRYIQYLDTRITELCAQTVQLGSFTATADLPCPPPDSLLPGFQIPEAGSSDTRIRAADQSLLESLGDFDEFLAEEQRKVMAKRPEAAGSAPSEPGASSGMAGRSGGAGGSQGQGGGESPGAMRNGGLNGNEGSEQMQTGEESGQESGEYQGETARETGPQGGMTGVQGKGGSRATRGMQGNQGQAHGSTGSQPGTVAGGRKGVKGQEGNESIYADDDIVARQLREAAEKETDPALKKKLWEEYRRYKEANR